jgi:hypothetical protein
VGLFFLSLMPMKKKLVIPETTTNSIHGEGPNDWMEDDQASKKESETAFYGCALAGLVIVVVAGIIAVVITFGLKYVFENLVK